ncbi:hypothetical protein EHLJMEHL_00482 [Vreelandella titanicae]
MPQHLLLGHFFNENGISKQLDISLTPISELQFKPLFNRVLSCLTHREKGRFPNEDSPVETSFLASRVNHRNTNNNELFSDRGVY